MCRCIQFQSRAQVWAVFAVRDGLFVCLFFLPRAAPRKLFSAEARNGALTLALARPITCPPARSFIALV